MAAATLLHDALGTLTKTGRLTLKDGALRSKGVAALLLASLKKDAQLANSGAAVLRALARTER